MSMWRVETPEPVFVDWAYRIEPYHYPALGMAKREYVVREIPEPGKKPLKNVVEAEIIARDLGHTHYQSWSHGTPFVTDFCAGDYFLPAHRPQPLPAGSRCRLCRRHRDRHRHIRKRPSRNHRPHRPAAGGAITNRLTHPARLRAVFLC